ncbi:hypothetical protein XHC_3152 [Xanthomonas hortorum pv. carotae str. M081]|nr:hypothetical protein XHC_3152 [Xanthomonas hortorum pv. carotae str. M081]
MSTYHLQQVFRPTTVAVVGGSPRDRSAGRAVVRNLRAAGFPGQIGWVSPRYSEIDGVRTVARLTDLTWVPDLVVITAPARIVPRIVSIAARRGVAAAIILTAGLGSGPGSPAARMEASARAKGMRILGPHCLGVIAPHARLNASIAAHCPQAGDLALISESSAIAAALVEWGVARSVGFSAVVSLGDTLDVDFGDLLDYFATDYRTRAILLYVERIGDARKFMSAARAAARAKPVVVVKSGRQFRINPNADTHAQALAGSDAVYGAAFARAGLLRVGALDELFAAAETLGRLGSFPGRRLAILSNGGGVGQLAVDQLVLRGGTLAELSAKTLERLDQSLPEGWSRSNPVDIIVDADGPRYAAAIEALLDDPGERRAAGGQRADRLHLLGRCGQGVDPRAGPTRPLSARKTGVCGVAGPGRCGDRRAQCRARAHLRHRIGRGARLHPPGALPRGAGGVDGNPAQPAGRLRGGCRHRPRGGR